MEETARGHARVEEIRAMTAADVALKKSLGNETVEKVMARQDAESLLKKTHIKCQTMKIEAEKEINVEVKTSEAGLAVAESKAVSFRPNDVLVMHIYDSILIMSSLTFFVNLRRLQ